MADQRLVDILSRGVEEWNEWQADNNIKLLVDFRGVNLEGADLRNADFREAQLVGAKLRNANLSNANLWGTDLTSADLRHTDLRGANLEDTRFNNANLAGADLRGAKFYTKSSNKLISFTLATQVRNANLTGANLSGTDLAEVKLNTANLHKANLSKVNLSGADLRGINLREVILKGANLSEANLSGADLFRSNLTNSNMMSSILINTNLAEADISNSNVFGVAAWNLKTKDTKQKNLIISNDDEPLVTVDDIEVAQFIYLLLYNEKIRAVIDTVTSKSVLILGRFTTERLRVLNAIRDALRQHDYVPILFDFEKPANRDLTETVRILAGMSRFVIADLSDPNSIPHEVMSFARELLSVPIQAIFTKTKHHANPYPMYADLMRLNNVLKIFEYQDQDHLISSFEENVINPAEAKATELMPPKFI